MFSTGILPSTKATGCVTGRARFPPGAARPARPPPLPSLSSPSASASIFLTMFLSRRCCSSGLSRAYSSASSCGTATRPSAARPPRLARPDPARGARPPGGPAGAAAAPPAPGPPAHLPAEQRLPVVLGAVLPARRSQRQRQAQRQQQRPHRAARPERPAARGGERAGGGRGARRRRVRPGRRERERAGWRKREWASLAQAFLRCQR